MSVHEVEYLYLFSAFVQCHISSKSVTEYVHENLTLFMACIFCILYIAFCIVKLNPGLPWQKLRSTRRRLSLPANWT